MNTNLITALYNLTHASEIAAKETKGNKSVEN